MNKDYNVGIVGAGLAGLSLAIQLSRNGQKVILFEKKSFPFHKLCGEYLSRESIPFLESIGIDLEKLKPSQIDHLLITNASSKKLNVDLPLGGIGLSRYVLDEELCRIARLNGVEVLENTLVKEIYRSENKHLIKTKSNEYVVDIAVSAFGKKSNLVNLNKFKENSLNQYVGIKYHVKLSDHPDGQISMHNFKDGYCGVCRVEGEWVSVCYLSHTDNFKACNNNIKELESNILFKNKNIRQVFENADFIYDKPIAVSNIDFKAKKLIHEGVFFVGDAAGLITPLCGNGMSMALHGSYILANELKTFFNNNSKKEELHLNYTKSWKAAFEKRMSVGRKIQKIFRKERAADFGVNLLNAVPFFNKQIVKMTHGTDFYKTSLD